MVYRSVIRSRAPVACIWARHKTLSFPRLCARVEHDDDDDDDQSFIFG